MNPWHRTPAFWLATLATAYCAMAGAWAILPSAWQPAIPEWAKAILATIGCVLPGAAALAKIIEAPRAAKTASPSSLDDPNPEH